ncbi:MAG: hypothetical protein H8E44_05075 [Planctomycetes bacterium]|nr:hypothetical protein [Planctomycetota bacterium]MBL7039476.1 hypothetical protein [Pirellulaceae bacterium]
MEKTHDRRFLGALGFSGFLGFLGFLGTDSYQHLAGFAWLACLSLASLFVLIPRDKSKVSVRYRLDNLADIFAALAGKSLQSQQDHKKTT